MYPLISRKQDVPFNQQVISSTTASTMVRLSGVEGMCSMQLHWEGGDGSVDMILSLEVSNDNKNWIELPSTLSISDDTGTHFWDFQTGADFLRVKVTVNAGSATFTASFNGKTR